MMEFATGRLTLSMGALAANYTLCQQHNSGAPVAAAVKANAYGIGVDQVVAQLRELGCQHFFAATLGEALSVRSLCPDENIQVYALEGCLQPPDVYLQHHIRPVLNTLEQCRVWNAAGQPCVIHIDTGMQRLGLRADEISQLMDLPGLSVALLMTHFACADQPDNPHNARQLSDFVVVHEQLCAHLDQKVPISMTNSAGLMGLVVPEQLARAGIGLYGGNPFSERDNPFHPVAQLQAKVIQIRDVQAGEAIGYGATFAREQPGRIATLGIGYADGVPRLLSNIGQVYFPSGMAPIVGRVSMDLISVDITELHDVATGDWAELFGANILVDDVAEQSQTISYELLVGIGPRVARNYQDALLD